MLLLCAKDLIVWQTCFSNSADAMRQAGESGVGGRERVRTAAVKAAVSVRQRMRPLHASEAMDGAVPLYLYSKFVKNFT
jgi:hypothetical protein